MINIKKNLKKYKVKTIDIINDTKNEHEINSKIVKKYVINMDKNEIRRNYMVVLFEKYKINYTMVIVEKVSNEINNLLNKEETITKGELGCLLSHLWCLNDTIENNYSNCIIFEDDIILHKKFHELFSKIYNPKIHFLLLGACDFSFSSLNYQHVKNGLYTPSKKSVKVYGAHSNYYSLCGAKKMMELKTKELSFFDKNYLEMFISFPNTSFICYPNLVVTDITTSNLQHIYELFSSNEKYYYKNCFINFNFNDYNFIYLFLLDYKELGIELNFNEMKTYEEFTNKVYYYYFLNNKYTTLLQNRIVKKFFTLKDIKMILNYK